MVPILPTSSPTGMPTTANPTQLLVCDPPITLIQRQELILAILNNVTPESIILTPGTSQNTAFDWLVDIDGAQACPENEIDVIQRYVLAVLYYSLGGDSWTVCSAMSSSTCEDDARYLSSTNVCQWFNVTCAADGGSVVNVILGMYTNDAIRVLSRPSTNLASF